MTESEWIRHELKRLHLTEVFTHITIHAGDDEMTSSCNDEYSLDINDCILTNGIVNTIMQTVNDATEIIYQTSVRGATYVIIAKMGVGSTPELNLYIDHPHWQSTCEEIYRLIHRLTANSGWDNMKYYLQQWRCNSKYILKNHQYLEGNHFENV